MRLPKGFIEKKWFTDTNNGKISTGGIYLCSLCINGRAFNKKITFIKK
jgi:hypothetical protein